MQPSIAYVRTVSGTGGAATRRSRCQQPGNRERAIPERAHGRKRIANIYGKLELRGRAAAAAFAVRKGLVPSA
jgi:hypothetical protein